MSAKVVIIGAGHGGLQAAASLREEGFEGEIVLISEENDQPYQKPPLSKGYLQGKQSEEAILFRSPHFFQNHQIDLRLGVNIAQLDTVGQLVITQEGETIDYTHLILATGAANRKLTMEGAADVLYLRTLADAKAIAHRLETAHKVAIIGGGFIGLELAALAKEKGKEVSVIEAQSRLMERVLPAVISDVFQKTHEKNGVQVYLNTLTKAIDGQYIIISDGKKIEADLILAGIGVIPETSLAVEAGIACENGILVNEYQQTSVANIYAIGDCANHYNAFAQKRLRLESVQNAVDQAKTAVNHVLGKAQPYHAVPWFWTNQYHLKLQMAGISAGFDRYVLRGDIDTDKFSVYYFQKNRLIAVDSLNRPADHLNARKLLAAQLSPTEAQISDLNVNLNQLLT
ncbi:ferredoxin-NAD reductase [Runella rosea]|uniref:Ferredoxin-NAD reductase n=1 Tax=Runella rosea TaxID=2259595 RepID=A0A344TER8_9BACT|nr:FAD-dependent oxidoreductase [Runella rosea]AXE17139.1 ferredoxin-NAD reductase [Runella rosea]